MSNLWNNIKKKRFINKWFKNLFLQRVAEFIYIEGDNKWFKLV